MRARRWWMLAVTCLSVIVVNLDLTILNITLPAISAALHAGTGDLQWLVDAYQLVFAAVMLPAGVIGDRVVRKRLLRAGLAVFLAASLWCALSVSAGELIAARALMGLGAGIVFPLSLAVVSAAFGDDEDRPKAIGILAAAVALGLPLGPVLGGLLLQHLSWHSVFWINVPAVCATLVAGAVLMPESRNSAAPPLDAPGALLSAGAVTGLVWGVINGQEHGWMTPLTWVLLAGSAVLVAAFLARERRSANPVIDPALFRDRRFTWGTIATVAVSVALFGILFVLPVFPERARLRRPQRRDPSPPPDGRTARRRQRHQRDREGHRHKSDGGSRTGSARGGTTRARPGPPRHGLRRGGSGARAGRGRRGGIDRRRDECRHGLRRRRRGRDGRVGEQHLAAGRRRPGGGSAGQRAVSRLHQGPAPVPREPARWRRRHGQRLHRPGRTGRRAPRHGRRRATAGGRNSVPPRHEHRHDQLRGGCRPRCHHQPGLPTARRRGGQRCRAPGTRRDNPRTQ